MTHAEDRAYRAAVESLAYRIRRGDGDPEFIAAEFMVALRGQGWRWLENLSPYAPHPAPVDVDEDAKAAALAPFRAKAAAHAEQFRVRDRGGGP